MLYAVQESVHMSSLTMIMTVRVRVRVRVSLVSETTSILLVTMGHQH